MFSAISQDILSYQRLVVKLVVKYSKILLFVFFFSG